MKRDKRQAALLGSDAHNITIPHQDWKYHISRKAFLHFEPYCNISYQQAVLNRCAVDIIMLQLPGS